MGLKRYFVYTLIAICTLSGVFYAGASWGMKKNVAKANAAQTISDTAHAQAVTHAAEAAKSDTQAQAQAVTVAKADKAVIAAKQKLANLPVIPDSSGVKESLTTVQATVIAAQDQEIAALKLQVSIEHASALQWKAAYEQESKALQAQQVVSQSYQKAMKEASWKSGFKGAIAGLAIGYVAGRLQH
jgi:hypothetical protein